MDKKIPAIIPAAGAGNRLRPITRYLSKPMLPLADLPLIYYSITEALSAGCDPVVVVGNPSDTALQNYVNEIAQRYHVRHVVQNKPRGLAAALLCGFENLNYRGSIALLLPDNVIIGGSGIKQLLKVNRCGLSFGTIEVTEEEAHYFGNSGGYKAQNLEGGLEKITELQQKGEGSFFEAAKQWPARRTVGRVILPEKFFELAAQSEPDPVSGELDDTPVYRQLLKESPAVGIKLTGRVFDMGTPRRYLRLSAAYWREKM